MQNAVLEKINSLQLPKDDTYALVHAASCASDKALETFIQTDFRRENAFVRFFRAIGLGYCGIDPCGWGFRLFCLFNIPVVLDRLVTYNPIGIVSVICVIMFFALNAFNRFCQSRRKRIKELAVYNRANKILSAGSSANNNANLNYLLMMLVRFI